MLKIWSPFNIQHDGAKRLPPNITLFSSAHSSSKNLSASQILRPSHPIFCPMRGMQICDLDFFQEANFDACTPPTLMLISYSLLDYAQMVVEVPPWVRRVPINSYFDPIINQLVLHIQFRKMEEQNHCPQGFANLHREQGVWWSLAIEFSKLLCQRCLVSNGFSEVNQ